MGLLAIPLVDLKYSGKNIFKEKNISIADSETRQTRDGKSQDQDFSSAMSDCSRGGMPL